MDLRIPADFPVTCWHLAVRGDPRGAWEICTHTAAKGCDLRVVGMTTYRIRG